jgi:ABC-type protease/lipase transport system fused ATPase/permease subunit
MVVNIAVTYCIEALICIHRLYDMIVNDDCIRLTNVVKIMLLTITHLSILTLYLHLLDRARKAAERMARDL